jgi:hypothetical protein
MPASQPAAAPARWVPVDVVLDADASRHDDDGDNEASSYRYTAFDGIDLDKIRAEALKGAAARKATADRAAATRARKAAAARAAGGEA